MLNDLFSNSQLKVIEVLKQRIDELENENEKLSQIKEERILGTEKCK